MVKTKDGSDGPRILSVTDLQILNGDQTTASLALTRRKDGAEMDAMIAGHATATGAVLITNNARHFSRAASLRVENWCRRIDEFRRMAHPQCPHS